MWPTLVRERVGLTRPLEVFDAQHPCVFVLSTGGVGTQTLAALGALSSHVLALHEPTPPLYGLSRRAYESEEDDTVSEVLSEAFMAARRELLQRALRMRRAYFETSPQVTFLAPLAAQAIEHCRFIHLVRDPRDAVRSGVRQRWYDGNPADSTRIWPRIGSEVHGRWARMSVLEKNAWLWTETNRWIQRFVLGLPSGRSLRVRSEDLFAARRDTLDALFRLLGTRAPSSKRVDRVLAQPPDAQPSGAGVTWTSDEHDALEAIAGEVAASLGYQL
jgi:hypothetical protein